MGEVTRERARIPDATIRRFDIFAEYQRVKAERSGLRHDQAKGYALWLAKVVAARRFARTEEVAVKMTELLKHGRERLRAGAEYLELAGEPQTAELYDRQIVERMGEEFYREVFAPEIANAVANRLGYEQIRDSMRVPWNFARKATKRAVG